MTNNIESGMTVQDAQADMRQGYFNGGPGVLASGIIWLIAGIIGVIFPIQTSVLALFFGGMVIHPFGIGISKLLGRSGSHSQGNPLASLALETTFLLFVGLFIAFYAVQSQSAWFFPIMLLIIGGRYLMFHTLYGMRFYWILGAILALAGAGLFFIDVPFATGAFIGGGLEIISGIIVIMMARTNPMSAS